MSTQITPVIPDRTHHVNSASGLGPKEWCPCFSGKKGDNEASIAGTLCHHAVESGSFEGLTDDQALAVDQVIKYRDGVAARFKAINGEGCRVLEEFDVRIDDNILPSGDVGTSGGILDYGIVSPNRDVAVLMDWKFVQWEVEPVETNIQFQVYTLGLMHAYKDLKSIEVHCVCPYLGFVDVHVFTRADFNRLYLRVCTVIGRALEPNAVRNPGFPICTFCANIGRCQAVANVVLHVSQKYDPIRVPQDIRPMFVGELDDKNRRDVMVLATICSSWAEAAKSQVNEVAVADGKAVEGFTLVRSSDRKVTDKEAFRQIALTYIPEDRWPECYDVFVSKVEDIIQKTAERGQGASTVREFGAALEADNVVERGPEKCYLRQKRQTVTE
jgi:hypothetical protein